MRSGEAVKKAPSVKDYGGDHYVSGRRGRTRLNKENTASHRCLSCGALRYVLPRELRRAARPHCLRCGGALEETAALQRREYGTKTERKRKRPYASPAQRCRACGLALGADFFHFVDTIGAAYGRHLASSQECQAYHVKEKHLATIGGAVYFQDTLRVTRQGSGTRPWTVLGMLVSGEERLIAAFSIRRAAVAAIDSGNFPARRLVASVK